MYLVLIFSKGLLLEILLKEMLKIDVLYTAKSTKSHKPKIRKPGRPKIPKYKNPQTEDPTI